MKKKFRFHNILYKKENMSKTYNIAFNGPKMRGRGQLTCLMTGRENKKKKAVICICIVPDYSM